MVQVFNTSIVLTFVVRNIIISTQYLVVLDRQILQRYISLANVIFTGIERRKHSYIQIGINQIFKK